MVGRSASLLGLFGLIALAFGVIAFLLTGSFADWVVLVNLVAGAGFLLAYLAFGFESFVGPHPLPIRHGMTVGELARLYRSELNLDLELEVIPCRGWSRSMHWADTGLPWVMPSPNMPTPETALVYPGACLIEGTNLSEGRGTTRPFELVGAPWLDPWKLAEALQSEGLPGVRFRPVFFTPTFQKHAGRLCLGVFVHPVDRKAFNPVRTGLALLRGIVALYPGRFEWKQPPYEYERQRLPIDIIAGGPWVREWAEGRHPWSAYDDRERLDVAAFERERRGYLLY